MKRARFTPAAVVELEDAARRVERAVTTNPEVLMKTRCHVYFHDRDDLVEIHTVWGAHRERGPSV